MLQSAVTLVRVPLLQGYFETLGVALKINEACEVRVCEIVWKIAR